MLIGLFLLQFVFFAFADIPPCNNANVFNMPQNTSVVTWYPYNFTRNTTPVFPINYECEYQINVPANWFAQIELVLITADGTPALVQVIDQLQRVEEVSYSDHEYFFFITSGGKIKLSTKSYAVHFGFSITWEQYKVNTQNVLYANKSLIDPIVFQGNGAYPTIVKADTKVSVTMASPVYYLKKYLRGIVFFDGRNWNGTSLGTGMQLLNAKTQYVSSGQYMTILYLGYHYYNNYFRILIQDFEHTKGIVQFQGLNCASLDSNCENIVLDATQGPSALQTYPDYISSPTFDVIMNIEGTGKLDVYSGSITDNKTNLVTSYTVANNNALRFPQVIAGIVKTYVLTEGNATITIAPERYKFAETEEFGQTGFIASRHYGSLSYSQDASGYIKSSQNTVAKFRFYIEKADLNGSARIEITGRQSSNTVYMRSYNSSNPPTLNHFDEFYGTDLDVKYYPVQQPTTGFYLEFEVEKGSSSYCFLAITMVSLFFSLIK